MRGKLHAFFRVDSSQKIGSGHLQRCLTLARELNKLGWRISFCLRSPDQKNIANIIDSGFTCHSLPSRPKMTSEGYEDWLEATWDQDVEEVIELLKLDKIDLVIVDHYALDSRWEEKIRPFTKKIIAIDDLANRSHISDLLLDQNYFSNFENRYELLVPKETITLLGPKYAMLREEFRISRNRVNWRSGDLKTIMIFYGGSDSTNETMKALQAIEKLEFVPTINLVVGNLNIRLAEIQNYVKDRHNIKMFVDANNMADIMMESDLALGAGGTTTWERAIVGLPSIVTAIAENQIEIADSLHKLGCHTYLGVHNEVDQNNLADCINLTSNDRNILVRQSKLSMDLVDGMGVQRVCQSIEEALLNS